LQLLKPVTIDHQTVLVAGFADMDTTWRWAQRHNKLGSRPRGRGGLQRRVARCSTAERKDRERRWLTCGAHHHVVSTSTKQTTTKTVWWSILNGSKSWMIEGFWFWSSMTKTKLKW
jgi:hypothetical protein